MELKGSKTMENLMRAFAGESQARNRYTIAASQAKKEKLAVIQAIFEYTAGQEKEHAEIFYNHLQPLAGQTLTIDGSFPVALAGSTLELLRMAQQAEFHEHDVAYKSFGDTAKAEGFQEIANSFYLIAEIEKTHGERFQKFADLLEQNKLFVADVETAWVCLNCGHIYTGTEVPEKCPVCSHDRGYFVRLTLAPYQE